MKIQLFKHEIFLEYPIQVGGKGGVAVQKPVKILALPKRGGLNLFDGFVIVHSA